MPGRRRKPIELKALEGTLRKDRDPDLESMEQITLPLSNVDPPTTIRDRKTKDAWALIILPLCATGRVSQEDVPALELAHLALQDVYLTQKRLVRLQRAKGWEDDPDAMSLIERLTRLISRRTSDYVKIMSRFGITPIERARLLAGAGPAKKQSLTERLLG